MTIEDGMVSPTVEMVESNRHPFSEIPGAVRVIGIAPPARAVDLPEIDIKITSSVVNAKRKIMAVWTMDGEELVPPDVPPILPLEPSEPEPDSTIPQAGPDDDWVQMVDRT
jgi:hypothetical protein